MWRKFFGECWSQRQQPHNSHNVARTICSWWCQVSQGWVSYFVCGLGVEMVWKIHAWMVGCSHGAPPDCYITNGCLYISYFVNKLPWNTLMNGCIIVLYAKNACISTHTHTHIYNHMCGCSTRWVAWWCIMWSMEAFEESPSLVQGIIDEYLSEDAWIPYP